MPLKNTNVIRKKELFKEILSSFLEVSLVLIMVNQGNLYAQDTTNQAINRQRSSNNLYLRAPDVIPGTLPEMRNPAYWIARMKAADKVVMTLTQIQHMNRDYQQRMSNISRLDSNMIKQIGQELKNSPGLLRFIPNFNSKSPAELSIITHNMINKEINYLMGRKYGNIMGIEYSDQELKAIKDEMAYGNISNQIKIKSGITVGDSRLRIIPSIRPEYIGLLNNKTRWDLWNLDVIPIGSSVQILHISKTGGFLFVLSEKGYGWISSEKIAISSTNEIDNFINAKDFIICTGEMVPFYSDSNCTYVSGWLRMGDRLAIQHNDHRLIRIPTRQVNGKFLIQDAWLKSDADIHRGYLPYSRKNVLLQAFKLLDNIYDWTGAWYGRDHATVLRDIFSCFGFELPSNGVLLSVYTDKIKIVYPKEGEEAQYKAIASNEPFLTFQISSNGHSQLYLGNYNGVPIVLDTNGYGYTDENGNELSIRRLVVGTVSVTDYLLKRNITFVELK